MKTKQLLGLLGSIILFIGVFTPVISNPLIPTMNYFYNGKGDGVFILILAAISLFLVLVKAYRGLWFTGIGSLGVMFFTLINFNSAMAQARLNLQVELADNPFRGIADSMLEATQLQWGWAVLVIGAALLIASAAVKEESY